MLIRTATIEDLDAVTTVEAECFPPSEAATRADFEQMLSAAGGSEVKLADALERLASRGLLRKSGILRATGGTPIQFSLSVMWLTQAGVDAAMSGNR